MLGELKELWRFRELLWVLVRRDLKVRYKNSFLGFLWSFANPIALTLVLTLVFKYIAHIGVPNYSAYILAALLPYTFFQQAWLDSAQSILGGMDLIRKVYFPREILPLAIILSNFIHLIMGLLVFFAFLLVIYLRHPAVSPFQWNLVYLPVLLVISLAMAIGLGLYFAAVNTFFEDLKYILGIVMFLFFYLCPIIYFVETVRYTREIPQSVHAPAYVAYNLNPLAAMTIAYRKVLLAPQQTDPGYPAVPLDWRYVGFCAGFSGLALVGGYAKFNKMKWHFVERDL
jgi:lipopolysaccharide transport system permease protein